MIDLDTGRADHDRMSFGRLWICLAEVLAQVGEEDLVLRPSRSCHGRLDGREIQLQRLVELWSTTGLAPQRVFLGVALDQLDQRLHTAGLAQIGERFVIDGKERGSRAVLRRHVGDRCSVGQGQGRKAVTGELDERAHDAMRTEHVADDQDQICGGRAAWQVAGQANANDAWHRLVERLAKEDGLGFDAADAVAKHAEPVDHRGVGVGPDERVRKGDRGAVLVLASHDDLGEVFEVYLVDDACAGRDDAQAVERGLCPAQQLVALRVALVLALHVERERVGGPETIDLHRVVDDQVGRHQRLDACRVSADRGHRVAHCGEIDDGRNPGEVLQQDAGRHEWNLGFDGGVRLPCRERARLGVADDTTPSVTEHVLHQDLDRHRRARQIGEAALVETVVGVVAVTHAERGARGKRIGNRG